MSDLASFWRSATFARPPRHRRWRPLGKDLAVSRGCRAGLGGRCRPGCPQPARRCADMGESASRACRPEGRDKSCRGHGDRSAAARGDYLEPAARSRSRRNRSVQSWSARSRRKATQCRFGERPAARCGGRARKRVLAVGTEFAFLPAFHQLAEEFATAGRIDLSLIWDDVEGEERYGATKVRHEETDLLCDLLPHAFSILRIFIPNVALRISAAHRTADGCQGRLEFRDDRGGQHELRCDSRAKARRRI